MYTITFIFLTTLRVMSAADKHSESGEKCLLIRHNNIGETKCKNTTSIHIETTRVDKQRICEYSVSSARLHFNGYLPFACHRRFLCWVPYRSSYQYRQEFNRSKTCKKCLPISDGITFTTNCRSLITTTINNMMYDKQKCQAELSFQRSDICEKSFSCLIANKRKAKIYHHCKGGSKILSDDIRTETRGCISTDAGTTAIITCPVTTVLTIVDLRYGESSCPAFNPLAKNMKYRKTVCKDSYTCSVPTSKANNQKASVYFQCKGGNAIPSDDITRKYHDGFKFAVIAGGVVGVVLIIFFIVGVVLLRRRYQSRTTQTPNKKNIMTKSKPPYDPIKGQSELEHSPQALLMNSSDNIHLPTLHAVNVANTTNEESNSYSHIRNTGDDSDVMYDHTVHHNVHNTCDGDYGITLRRITEDDYDVSGNYRQSLTNREDLVYN